MNSQPAMGTQERAQAQTTESETTESDHNPYRSDAQAVIEKVKQDILFLTDRIERIKKLQTPNSSVLKTYQAMLESREAVLRWLSESDKKATPPAVDLTEAG